MKSKNHFNILISSIAMVAFALVFASCAKKENTEELARIAELERTIAEKDKLAQEEAKKAALAEEARQLAEAKAAREAVAQQERLAEIAALKASEEAAQRRAEVLRREAEQEAAKLLVLAAIERGADLELPPAWRIFFYFPLMHAEQVAPQELGVR